MQLVQLRQVWIVDIKAYSIELRQLGSTRENLYYHRTIFSLLSQLVSLKLADNIREDLSRKIGFVLEKKKRKNLHLVSASKESMVLFGLLSTTSDYEERVRVHITLRVQYMKEFISVVIFLMTILGFPLQVDEM